MAKLPHGEVLDVGAGEAPWREWLPEGCKYRGLDVAYAGEFGMAGDPDVVYYDGRVMPFENASFEASLCIEVLEHAEAPEFLLREILRVLRPGAPLLLSVPWSARRHHIPHDYHRFTREALEQLFVQVGFVVEEIAERGDDFSVIANKLLVATIRSWKGISVLNFLRQIPLLFVLGAMAMPMLVLAHASLWFHWGAKEDPLGYFCRVRKPLEG